MEEVSMYILILIGLIISSAYFSASETSFSSVSIVRLEGMLIKKRKNLKHFSIKLAQDFTSTLSIILILNNIVNLTAASVSIMLFTKLNISNAILFSTVFITIAILIFGEFLPKVFAIRHPELFAIHFGWILNIIIKVSKPITYLISLFVKNKQKKTTTEKELLRTLNEIEREGEIEKEESTLIKSALKFDDKTIKSIFTKWNKVVKVNYNMTIEQALPMIMKEKHSRMPVLKNNKVIGFVSIVDLFGKSKKSKVVSYIRPVHFISRNIHLDDALEMMQKCKQHILIVTKYQNQNEPIGIVTMEDLIEEIVGEIYDETDDIPLVMEVGHHGHLVSGKASVKEVFESINATMPLISNISFYDWVLLTLDKENKKDISCFKSFEYDNYKILLAEEKGKDSVFQLVEI